MDSGRFGAILMHYIVRAVKTKDEAMLKALAEKLQSVNEKNGKLKEDLRMEESCQTGLHLDKATLADLYNEVTYFSGEQLKMKRVLCQLNFKWRNDAYLNWPRKKKHKRRHHHSMQRRGWCLEDFCANSSVFTKRSH